MGPCVYLHRKIIIAFCRLRKKVCGYTTHALSCVYYYTLLLEDKYITTWFVFDVLTIWGFLISWLSLTVLYNDIKIFYTYFHTGLNFSTTFLRTHLYTEVQNFTEDFVLSSSCAIILQKKVTKFIWLFSCISFPENISVSSTGTTDLNLFPLFPLQREEGVDWYEQILNSSL
jgi:hypothetical protein